jgi:hypothetical protein
MSGSINPRDRAFAELEAAGVIEPAGFDGNGNLSYRFLGFPSGADGEALKALFDRHIQGRRNGRRER